MGHRFETYDSGGDSSGTHQLNVFVYPDGTSEDDLCENQVAPGLAESFEQAYNESSVIDYWEVAITYEHPYQWSYGDDKYDALENFRDYLKDQSFLSTGSHLLIDDSYEGGLADGGDITCNDSREDPRSGWNDWAPAVHGTNGDSGNYLKNISVQEALHNFIDVCVPGVSSLVDDDEHDLGQVYQNVWNDTASPMTTSYISDHADHGDCESDANWDGDYTQHVSSCTVDALDETALYH